MAAITHLGNLQGTRNDLNITVSSAQHVATPVNCPKIITMEIWGVVSKG